MPSDADVRSVLREHGVAVTNRGKLGARHYAEYERITGHVINPDAWDGPDDNADIIEAQAPRTGSADTVGVAGDGPGPDEAVTPSEMPQERRPRKVHRPGPSLTDRLRKRATAGSSSRKKTKHARLSTDRLISRGWGTAARLSRGFSPATSRTFELQAPVAGLILEDTVRGTVVDTFLQPAVRWEARGEKVFALAGPPLLVAAIERAQGLEEPARSLRLAILVPMLEEALGMWAKIAGDKMTEAAEQMEANAATQAEIQRLIGLIFPQATVSEPAPAPDMAGAPA